MSNILEGQEMKTIKISGYENVLKALISTCAFLIVLIISSVSYGDEIPGYYENDEYGFSIQYPADYVVEEPQGWEEPTEVFRARSPVGHPLLTIRINYMEDDTDYKEILSIYKDSLRMWGITGVNPKPKRDILLPDSTIAWQTEIAHKSSGYDMRSLTLWVQKYNRWFSVEVTTLEGDWLNDVDEITDIVDSFTGPTRDDPDAIQYITFKEDIPMSDSDSGVRGMTMPAYVVLPKDGGPDGKPYPIIFWYTAYSARVHKLLTMSKGDDDMLFGPDGRANYGFVLAPSRGRYEGLDAWYPGCPTPGQDGVSYVDWIARQTWCDGNIGIWCWGGDASSGYETVKEDPTNIKALVPQFSPWLTEDYFRFYPGGVLREANLDFANDQWDETELWEFVTSHPYDSEWWDEYFSKRPEFDDIDVPVLVDNGWFAHNINHGFSTYKGLSTKGTVAGDKTKTIIGPWAHMYPGNLLQGALKYPNASKEERAYHRRFFDCLLKGEDQDFYYEPPVYYYQMTDVNEKGEDKGEWKFAKEWPPTGAIDTKYYLHAAGNKLLPIPPAVGASGYKQYTFDPADPSPGIGGPYVWPTNKYPIPMEIIGPAYQDIGVLLDKDTLLPRNDFVTYDMDILEEDLVVSGNPSCKLYIQAYSPSGLTIRDTDIVIRLCDYDPEAELGKRTLLVGIAPQRMRYREGFRKQVPMAGGVYEVEIKMDPIAYTWKEGHQVRIIVTSSAYPLYAINPNNGYHFMPGISGKWWLDSRPGAPLIANVLLWNYSGPEFASYMALPVQAPTPAKITSPEPASTLAADDFNPDGSVTFEWGPVFAGKQYCLTLEQPEGDFFYWNWVKDGTDDVPGIKLNGEQVHVKLWSNVDGTWHTESYTYETELVPAPAELISPSPHNLGPIPSGLTTFEWTEGVCTEPMPLFRGKYIFKIGTTFFAGDIHNPGWGATDDTQVDVDLPPGEHIYVSLTSRVQGKIYTKTYEFDTQ